MESLDICYVVNAVGEGSIPADIATAVTTSTAHSVDLVTWFGGGEFEGDDVVDVSHVDAPDTALGIDRPTYRRARFELAGYDVVQAHHNHSGSFAKVIARRLGIPTVSREGNTRDGFTLKGRVANGLTNPLTDRVVCISRSVHESFRGWERAFLPDDDVEIIPNGVEPQRIRAHGGDEFLDPYLRDEDSFVVGNAAMLYEQKAQDVLVEAVGAVNHGTDRTVELVIAGEGPRRSDLERLVEEQGLSDVVHFLGYTKRRNVYAMLSEIDLFSMPSRWEGFCVAVAEALAAGAPCVLSDIDPFLELYADAAEFHEVDDVEDLATVLTTLVGDSSRREALSERGRKLADRKYAIDVVATAYADLYEQITAEREN